MDIVKVLIEEIKDEAENTRKLLECVPDGKNDWKPHERSFPLGRLAGHVAEILDWVYWITKKDEFDLTKDNFERFIPEDNKALLAHFERKLEEAVTILRATTPEQLEEEWTFLIGGNVYTKGTRYHEIRKWAFNHLYHHRGQLGVYLRLLDIPIPGMYGPSADDRARMKK